MTVELFFLSVDEVIEVHEAVAEASGGSKGIRDRGLLESAVNMPTTTFGGVLLHDGLAAMAAAYLYHLCQNHPFFDGNKRVGVTCAEVFLTLNRAELDASDDELERFTMAVADGSLGKPELTELFRRIVNDSGRA